MNRSSEGIRGLLIGTALLVGAGGVHADAGDIKVRVGAHVVAPKSNNHAIVDADSATMLTFSGSWFATDHWAVELLAALPFKHDINLRGGDKVADTRQLPPTLSAQYHFLPDGRFSPYAGLGLNVTLFFDEATTGALESSNLSLGTSVGLAAQLGVDVDLTEKLFLNAEVRYMDIDTKAKLDGASLGRVHIDPWVFGLSLGMKL